MKKYIYLSLVIVISFFIGHNFSKAAASINGEFVTSMYSASGIDLPILTGSRQSQEQISTSIPLDPVVRVPSGVFIAHIQTSGGMIDVQRFIDPSTNVACYYSERMGTVVSTNCVVVSADAQ